MLGAHAEAMLLADEMSLDLCRAWTLAALGDLNMVMGRTDEALSYFEKEDSLLRSAGIVDVDLSPGPELVELHLRQGNADRAAAIAKEYGAQAELKGQPWALAALHEPVACWQTIHKSMRCSPRRSRPTGARRISSRPRELISPTVRACVGLVNV